jgi:hypothetical protein
MFLKWCLFKGYSRHLKIIIGLSAVSEFVREYFVVSSSMIGWHKRFLRQRLSDIALSETALNFCSSYVSVSYVSNRANADFALSPTVLISIQHCLRQRRCRISAVSMSVVYDTADRRTFLNIFANTTKIEIALVLKSRQHIEDIQEKRGQEYRNTVSHILSFRWYGPFLLFPYIWEISGAGRSG